MTDFTEERTALVVVEENDAVFDGEEQQESIDDLHLKGWIDRAITICEKTAERVGKIERVQLLAMEIQVFRKNYMMALGYLLTYMQDTGLYKDAGFNSLQDLCTINLGIHSSDRIACMSLYQAGYWMRRLGYSPDEVTDTSMTPIKSAEIARIANDAAKQSDMRQKQYKNKPDQLKQILEEEQRQVVAMIDTIRQRSDQEIVQTNERRIGALEKVDASFTDIRISKGQIFGVFTIPAEPDAAALLERALKGAFNVLCRTADNRSATFNLKELSTTLFSDEEF